MRSPRATVRAWPISSRSAEYQLRYERWRDNRLAVETARVLAAPDAETRARALADRALVLIAGGKLDEAERQLLRADRFDWWAARTSTAATPRLAAG